MKITSNFQSQAKRIALISKKRLFDYHYQKFFFRFETMNRLSKSMLKIVA